jgi:hypothetical protein
VPKVDNIIVFHENPQFFYKWFKIAETSVHNIDPRPWFLSTLLRVGNVESVSHLVTSLTPGYVLYSFNILFIAIFYGLGKTHLVIQALTKDDEILRFSMMIFGIKVMQNTNCGKSGRNIWATSVLF